jgi:hypothetical protein
VQGDLVDCVDDVTVHGECLWAEERLDPAQADGK